MDTYSVYGIRSNNSTVVTYLMSLKYLFRLVSLVAALTLAAFILWQRLDKIIPATPNTTSTNEITSPLTLTPPLAPSAAPTNEVYLPVILSTPSWTITYYVDSTLGSDKNSCESAQNPTTPKKTIPGVMICNPGPGQTVRFKGEFKDTILPTRSGSVIYNVQDIAEVNGSVVSFNQPIAYVYSTTDYVTIYGSRKGNSGAFAVKSISGNNVTVDTSDLPSGQFLPEIASDPGALQAAILRPVHFTAWDENNPPIWSGKYQVYHAINQSVIMVSHIKSIGGNSINPGFYVWPAFEIDGNNSGNSDFQIFDHLEVTNAESAIATEANEYHSNYDILQHNNIHNVGASGGSFDELIYWGYWGRPDLDHNFVQIMYNIIGPHNSGAMGDGIDIKQSAERATIFGNEFVGLIPQGCADAPIKDAGINAFIANNYLHDINNPASPGACGISITDDEPHDPTSGGEGAIVVNNIMANINGPGIKVVDATGVQVLNNTVYNIMPEPNCNPGDHCMEFSMGILIHNWQGPIENMVIKNNIVQNAYIGIGRYIGSHEEFPISIDSDYNLVYDANFPFRGTIIQNTNDRVMQPGLVDPQNQNFALITTSPGRDTGADLTSIFSIDNHDAPDPTLPAITAPINRISPWDRGAYEYR